MKDLRSNINKVVNEHVEPVDSDAIWAGIERKMNRPKKNRRFIPFLIWGVCLSFLVLAVVSSYFLDDGQQSVANNSIPIIEHEVNDDKTKIGDTQKEYKLPAPESSIIASSNPPAKEETIKQMGDIKEPKTKWKNKDWNTVSALNSSKEDRNSEEDKIYKPNNYIEDAIQDSGDYNSKNELLIKGELNSNQGGSLNGVAIERTIMKFDRIESSLKLDFERPKVEVPGIFIMPYPKPSKTTGKFTLFNSLTAYTQYGFGSKTIPGNVLRSDSEELLEQLRIGLESDLVSILDFTLYGGVSYASINDRVTIEESFYEDRELDYLKTIIIIDDVEEYEYASGSFPHLNTKRSIRHNSHRLISMPIGLRFGKEFSSFQIGIGFGLDFNYYLSDTHTVLAEDGSLSSVVVGGKWVNPSLHSALTVDYPISDRWYLHSKIMYRHTSISNATAENDIQQTYKLYGIDLGMKFQF